MASDVIRTAYRRTWLALMLRGLLAIAIGAFILWRPLDSIASFALVIALWALFTGIVQMVHSFELRSVLAQWWVLLLTGFVGAAFGVAALYYYPGLSLAFAVVWTTWWLILSGAFAIYAAVWERSLGLSWGWTLAFGIVSIAAGVLAIMNPPATLAAIIGLIAGFALVSGVVLLIGAFRLSAAKAAVADAFHA
jgi:uncharacterized membrane protein HdeD (DUF308 family)